MFMEEMNDDMNTDEMGEETNDDTVSDDMGDETDEAGEDVL